MEIKKLCPKNCVCFVLGCYKTISCKDERQTGIFQRPQLDVGDHIFSLLLVPNERAGDTIEKFSVIFPEFNGIKTDPTHELKFVKYF